MNRILAGVIFFLFISTGYIFSLVYERQQELQKLTHYIDPWSVARLVSQYYRFESLLGLYTTDDTMNLDDVCMRLDTMLGQSDLMKEGDLGHYIESNIAHCELAVKLENILSFPDVNLEKINHLVLWVLFPTHIPELTRPS